MTGRVLVTGAAGYIGSHAVAGLRRRGAEVVALDDLSEGHAAALPRDVELARISLEDEEAVARLLRREKIGSVMHFAASCLVGESMADPGKYYRNNVEASLKLLRAIRSAGVPTVVFSSTAATYGEPLRTPIDESHPTQPINPYGTTKLLFERALEDHGRAHGLRWAALRYFNAAGAAASGDLGEDHDPETHLIPLVLRAALEGEPVSVFGADYPTPDGTCVRDYIHVEDLSDAHALALEHLERGGESGAFNLGTGEGFTVRQVIEVSRKVTGRPIEERAAPRRAGDPAVLVAEGAKARRVLGWKPRLSDLPSIVSSAWRWHSTHPEGYR
jgi:UDP-glucose 4-epimerase